MRRLAILLILTACTVEEPVAPPEPATEPQREPAPPTEVSQPAPEPPQLSPDVTPVQDLSAAIQQLGRLMGKMREATQEAGQNAEGDDCAKARAVYLASNEALRAAIAEEPLPGGRTPPFWQVLGARSFARQCHRLPEEVQSCVRLDVRANERERCTRALRELTEEQKAIVDALAQSVREEPEAPSD